MKTLIVLLFFCVAATSQAAEVCFTWNDMSTSGLDKLTIYENSSTTPVINDIPVTETTACMPSQEDEVVRNYWMTGWKGPIQSPRSEVIPFATTLPDPPPPEQVVKIEGFSVTIKVEPIQ